MDRAQLVQKRKRQYMAQVLEAFDEQIAPHIAPAHAGEVQDFKGLVRARMNRLASDAIDYLDRDTAQNGVALDQRDALAIHRTRSS